jgi:hypothetical protein
MPELIHHRATAANVLSDFKEHYTPAILDRMFIKVDVLNDVYGRAAYLRNVIRQSSACDRSFDRMFTTCAAAGIILGRRSSFRAGVVLGLLIAEDATETDR